MSTEAQINANRLNALKSTGPTSPEGQTRSALNTLKSGIDALPHIIPGENCTELEALTAEFLLHFHPSDPNQRSLVDTLIAAEWTQRRIDATNRMYLGTLKALQDLQSAATDPIPIQPLTPQIGFVPQTTSATEPRTSVSGEPPLEIHTSPLQIPNPKSQIPINLPPDRRSTI